MFVVVPATFSHRDVAVLYCNKSLSAADVICTSDASDTRDPVSERTAKTPLVAFERTTNATASLRFGAAGSVNVSPPATAGLHHNTEPSVNADVFNCRILPNVVT